MSGTLRPESELNTAYRALIESDRVSAGTRAVLLARTEPPDGADDASVFSIELRSVLRALLNRLLPVDAIDLAARLEATLATGAGDGWRFAGLPPDAEAYRAGLATIDAIARSRYGAPFADLPATQQDDCLRFCAGGDAAWPSQASRLDASQMTQWIGELRSDAVRVYVAHPLTLARIGYGGIGLGGDQARLVGFEAIGLGQREQWEPVALSPQKDPP